MKLSRVPTPVAGPSPRKANRRPLGSRSRMNTGWTTKRTSMPCSLSSPSTELTRNGMSSLTISRIETDLMCSAAIGPAREVEADLRRPRLAVRQQRPGVLGERRKLARLIAEKILGRRAPEQASGESRRHVVAQPGQDRAHLLDEPAPGAFVFGADQGLYVHCLHPTPSPALLSARQGVSGPRSARRQSSPSSMSRRER